MEYHKMNAHVVLARLSKTFALVLSILLFFSSGPAMAKVICTNADLVATVTNGSFKVSTPLIKNPLDKQTTVRRAILVLPEGEVGTIKSIKISGKIKKSDGTLADANVFGCVNTNVKNGIDLIKACGGPAVIPDQTTLEEFQYQAEGIGFGPNPNFNFNIVLFDNFG
jgi:hypothetical protein